jgi:15-cis-phytoene synthase
MTSEALAWEHQLLVQARGALTTPCLEDLPVVDAQALRYAYDYCKVVVHANSRTFGLACRLLPPDKRRAAHALYAFCRATDDLVDETQLVPSTEDLIAGWRSRLSVSFLAAHDPVPLAWADTQTRYGIPRGYADQLIDGITRDLHQQRYQTFGELAEYCYGVASTVGLMVMHIIGFDDEGAIPHAIKLGVALQLTNILRDVGEDWANGRLYLPLTELAEFGLGEADIEAGFVSDAWRAFMRFQLGRARQLYREAQPGIQFLESDGRLAIGAAAGLYRAILDDIEAHDYDVFHRRAYLPALEKLKRIPAVWWSCRMTSRPQ